MKSPSPIVVSALLLLGITVAVVEWNMISNLRSENLELKNQLQQSKAIDESALKQKQAQLSAETEQLRAQLKELPRLRGELQQLRKATNELAKLREENQQLKSRGVAVASILSAPADQGTSFKKENWAFAGYATPDSTLQSMVWAMSQGDMKTFLAGVSPEGRAMLEKEWENKTEAQIADEGRKEMEKTTGYHILDRKTVSNEEVELQMVMDGENHIEKISMKKYGNEWKFAGPTRE
jgi:hypothetical protein